MNKEQLNTLLVEIADKRMELSRLSYADTEYDQVEEELHALEDRFVDCFGNVVETILEQVHEKYCPDTEILSPIAYLAKKYVKTGVYGNGSAIYDIPDMQQGLVVDADEYQKARLVLLPNPVRIILTGQKQQEIIKEEIWKV